MRRKWLFLLVLLAPLGCVTPENVQPPSFDVANLRLGSPGLFSQELKIDLKIGNPNDFDIPLTGLAFKLEVNGEHFAEGLSNESVTLPRLGYANVRVTGNANTLSILRQLVTMGTREKIEYRLYGNAHVGRLGVNQTTPFERKGSLSLLPAPLGHSQGPAGIRMFAPNPRR